jgi:hypothetical protein
LSDKEEVIKYNKEEEEQMKHILDEIWEHILQFIFNHKTTIPLFYFSDISENNSEN